MSDNDNILEVNGRARLTADVTLLMLKGGGYALVFCLALWFFIAVIAMIGRALPDESRQTPDPINRSSLQIEAPLIQAT